MLKSTLFFLGLTLLLILSSCEDHKAALPEVGITQNISVDRFELEFVNPNNSLSELKGNYPYLFPVQTPDSIWEQKRKDSLELLLVKAVDSVFGDFSKQKQELNQLLSNYNYYFPKATIPKGITLTTNIDYFSRVIYADSLLLMGLDNFLGASHPYYQNFPAYLRSSMNPDNFIHALAKELSKAQLPNNTETTFLSKLIQEGKLLYLQERLTPNASTAKRLGYTDEQYQWVQLNEAEIWRYFIDRELLYSTDKELESRFINTAPFSKFKLAIDQESPGGVGRYIGYRIVSSYMNKSNTSIDLLLQLDAVSILKNATYKPKKS